MSATNGVLALVGDPVLRDDVDRVVAAAGLNVVHAVEPSSRKVWTSAVAILVVVAPADVRSCAAAAAIVPWVTAINPNAGLVVRGPAPSGLRARDVAKIVGLPVLAAMRPQSGIAEALERGGLRIHRR